MGASIGILAIVDDFMLLSAISFRIHFAVVQPSANVVNVLSVNDFLVAFLSMHYFGPGCHFTAAP